MRKLKDENEKKENHFVIEHKAETERFISSLPYRLTDAQKKVWKEIELDMGSRYAMSRLIQGDVGSGKTIVAVLALISVGMNGYQGAMMAPTEVLARQHFESITKLFDTYQIPLKVGLLTGSMTAKEKKEAYARIEAGEVQVIIGTHALIQEKVHYKNLALAITDEQHRFAVQAEGNIF